MRVLPYRGACLQTNNFLFFAMLNEIERLIAQNDRNTHAGGIHVHCCEVFSCIYFKENRFKPYKNTCFTRGKAVS